MNKTEMIEVVSVKTGLAKKDAKAAVEAVLESISEELAAGNKVALVGFGTFDVTERAARTGHNPLTGAAMEIPASKAVSFKASSALKEQVNK